jgi:hypothetical protein
VKEHAKLAGLPANKSRKARVPAGLEDIAKHSARIGDMPPERR